LRGIEIGIEL